jgi:hypothetical protein
MARYHAIRESLREAEGQLGLAILSVFIPEARSAVGDPSGDPEG